MLNDKFSVQAPASYLDTNAYYVVTFSISEVKPVKEGKRPKDAKKIRSLNRWFKPCSKNGTVTVEIPVDAELHRTLRKQRMQVQGTIKPSSKFHWLIGKRATFFPKR